MERPDDAIAAASVVDSADSINSVDLSVDEKSDEPSENRLSENDEPHSLDGGGSGDLREGDSSGNNPVAPTSPIDYTTADDSPYEHDFEVGDHVIRWDMLPILWPIQVCPFDCL